MCPAGKIQHRSLPVTCIYRKTAIIGDLASSLAACRLYAPGSLLYQCAYNPPNCPAACMYRGAAPLLRIKVYAEKRQNKMNLDNIYLLLFWLIILHYQYYCVPHIGILMPTCSKTEIIETARNPPPADHSHPRVHHTLTAGRSNTAETIQFFDYD